MHEAVGPALTAAAGVNAALFHRSPFISVNIWNRDAATPHTAKVMACLSLLLWAGVITWGRLLAYL
jgi:hypothetical protein